MLKLSTTRLWLNISLITLALQPVAAISEKYVPGSSIAYYALLFLVLVSQAGLTGAAIYAPFGIAVAMATIIRTMNGLAEPDAYADIGRLLLCWAGFAYGSYIRSKNAALKRLHLVAMATVVVMFVGQLYAHAVGMRLIASGYEVLDYKYALIGLTKHPAITAIILFSTLPLLIISKGRLSKLLVIIATIATIATFRRSSWLSIAILFTPILVAWVLRPGLSARALIMVFTVGLAAVAFEPVVGLFAGSDVASAMRDRVAEAFTGRGTASGRRQFWPLAIELYRSAPIIEQIFGIGRDPLLTYMRSWFGIRIGAHNDFLNVLIVHGLFAATALTWFYGALIARFVRIRAALSTREFRGAWLIDLGAVAATLALAITTGGVFDPQYILVHIYFGFRFAAVSKSSADLAQATVGGRA